MPFQTNFSFSEKQDEAYLTKLEAEKREELQKLVSEFEPEACPSGLSPARYLP